jgi:hypothetical protein
MKKKVLKKLFEHFAEGFISLFILMLVSMSGFAQNVGISPSGASAPNTTAGLDVNFTTKGLLIPRVALQSTISSLPIASHIAGMLVYNTATVGDVTPGFYYNNGTTWIAGIPKANAAGDIQYWDGAAWVTIPAGSPGQLLKLDAAGLPVWGNSVVLPTVTTNAVTAILSTSATSGGIVLNDGGSPVTAYGVCWSTTPTPTISNSLTTNGTGIGSFTSNITGLVTATVYYMRAYATTINGTVYGAEYSFTTL